MAKQGKRSAPTSSPQSAEWVTNLQRAMQGINLEISDFSINGDIDGVMGSKTRLAMREASIKVQMELVKAGLLEKDDVDGIWGKKSAKAGAELSEKLKDPAMKQLVETLNEGRRLGLISERIKAEQEREELGELLETYEPRIENLKQTTEAAPILAAPAVAHKTEAPPSVLAPMEEAAPILPEVEVTEAESQAPTAAEIIEEIKNSSPAPLTPEFKEKAQPTALSIETPNNKLAKIMNMVAKGQIRVDEATTPAEQQRNLGFNAHDPFKLSNPVATAGFAKKIAEFKDWKDSWQPAAIWVGFETKNVIYQHSMAQRGRPVPDGMAFHDSRVDKTLYAKAEADARAIEGPVLSLSHDENMDTAAQAIKAVIYHAHGVKTRHMANLVDRAIEEQTGQKADAYFTNLAERYKLPENKTEPPADTPAQRQRQPAQSPSTGPTYF